MQEALAALALAEAAVARLKREITRLDDASLMCEEVVIDEDHPVAGSGGVGYLVFRRGKTTDTLTFFVPEGCR